MPLPDLKDYRYRLAHVYDVIDGDTIELRIERPVGFYLTLNWDIRVRLHGIDCPEMRGATRAAGQAAAAFTRNWLNGRECIVQTIAKAGTGAQSSSGTGQKSFERWIGHVYDENSSLAEELIKAGHARALLT